MRVWVASLIFYVSVFVLCEISRYFVSKVIKHRNAYLAELLNEVIWNYVFMQEFDKF